MPPSSVADENHARYACDSCRGKKLSCTRELPRCHTCKAKGMSCSYSRAGKLRRRKRKDTTPLSQHQSLENPQPSVMLPPSTGRTKITLHEPIPEDSSSVRSQPLPSESAIFSLHDPNPELEDMQQSAWQPPPPDIAMNSTPRSHLETIRRSRLRPTPSEIAMNPTPEPSREDTQRREMPPPPPEGASNSSNGRLKSLFGCDQPSTKLLASLMDKNAAAWQDSTPFKRLVEYPQDHYILIQETQNREFVDNFVMTIQKEQLLLTTVPLEVITKLYQLCPDQVDDRAWLVMFYSVALKDASSYDEHNEELIEHLRINLWVAFNEARWLIEPSVTGMQALFIMACYVEEWITPSICWSLISQACIMLQALGINDWRLDSSTRAQRSMFFWRLNFMDKALALVLGRRPILHRDMADKITLPTPNQLLPSQRHHAPGDIPTFFTAHFTQQMYRFSIMMGEVWYCVHDQDTEQVPTVLARLEKWHQQATEVLRAAEVTEKDFLSTNGKESIELGLQTLHFYYYYLLFLLSTSSKATQYRSTHSAHQMLLLLPDLGVLMRACDELYPTPLWLKLHSPSMAFGALWGSIVMKRKTNFEQCQEWLEALKKLPEFLETVCWRADLAVWQNSFAEQFIELTNSILYSQEDESGQPSHIQSQEDQHPNPYSTHSYLISPNVSIPSTDNTFGGQLDNPFTTPDDALSDPMFDWLAWYSQQFPL